MSPASSTPRLAHVDALRGLAALLVAVAHFCEPLRQFSAPAGLAAAVLRWPEFLNLGRVGVILFFGLSGFVIYGSLEKGGPHPGQRFAVARFFRLYPAFWLSLLLGSLLLWPLAGQPVNWPMLWANATMYPSLFGQERVRDLYWTLEVELTFYVACWALHRGGLMRRSALLPGLIAGLTIFWVCTHAHGFAATTQAQWVSQPRYLAIMFWGALIRQSYDETGGFRTGVRGNAKAWWLAGLTCLLMVAFAPGAVTWLARGFRSGDATGVAPPPTSIAYLIALPSFWAWIAAVRMKNEVGLPWLGTISYSLYLFHPAAQRCLFATLPTRWLAAAPVAIGLGLSLIGAVLISAAVYYAVELPAMRLGARITSRLRAVPARNERSRTF